MDFGYKFAELRRAHGLTRQELAIKLDISVETILNLENGNIKPNNTQINKICETFKISQELLLNNDFDIENILDKLYSSEYERISYRDNVKTLNKKESTLVLIVVFIILAMFIGMSIFFQISMNKMFNMFNDF